MHFLVVIPWSISAYFTSCVFALYTLQAIEYPDKAEEIVQLLKQKEQVIIYLLFKYLFYDVISYFIYILLYYIVIFTARSSYASAVLGS